MARHTFSCTPCELESKFRKLRHAYVVFVKSFSHHLFFETCKRDLFFLLGIRVTVTKFRLQDNAVTLDLILIRQAWKN